MSGLILKLGPKERILINGAVIENGDRRSRLAIMTPDANILRLRDAIHPEDAKTPVRRVCYAVQLVLSGDVMLGANAVLKLDKKIDDPVDLFVGDKLIARGTLEEDTESENGQLLVRLTQVIDMKSGIE
jgi:flagellar protein FlbT